MLSIYTRNVYKVVEMKITDITMYTFPNEESFNRFRANYQKQLSLFKFVDEPVLLEILKLLSPVDLSGCRKSGQFLNEFISHFSENLRQVTLDITIKGENIYRWDLIRSKPIRFERRLEHRVLRVIYKYRSGNYILSKTLSHNVEIYNLHDKVEMLKLYKNKTIDILRFSNVDFAINKCIKIFCFLWDIEAKVNQLIIKDCFMQYNDKFYVGTIPTYHYFFILLHQIAAKIIRFYNSPNISRLSHLFLNNSSMHSAEQVFFVETHVLLTVRNIPQFYVHNYLNNNISFEWRSPNFNPATTCRSRDSNELTLSDWFDDQLKSIEEIPQPAYYHSKGLITIPLEQQMEIKTATLETTWNNHYIFIRKLQYK